MKIFSEWVLSYIFCKNLPHWHVIKPYRVQEWLPANHENDNISIPYCFSPLFPHIRKLSQKWTPKSQPLICTDFVKRCISFFGSWTSGSTSIAWGRGKKHPLCCILRVICDDVFEKWVTATQRCWKSPIQIRTCGKLVGSMKQAYKNLR